MGKKKSKTQKYKRNLKRKQLKLNKSIAKVRVDDGENNVSKQVVPKDKVNYNVPLTKPGILKNSLKKKNNDVIIRNVKLKKNEKVRNKKQKLEYENNLTEEFKILNKKENLDNYGIDLPKLKEKNSLNLLNKIKKKLNDIKLKIIPSHSKVKRTVRYVKSYDDIPKDKLSKSKVKVNKKNDASKLGEKVNTYNKGKKNFLIRLLSEIIHNIHIIFNSVLIITFIVLLTGLIRINVFERGTIIYICCILLFLMIVAISYNRYISGKIFTLILCCGMGVAIYHMQYTYDFVRNLNSSVYEYKTYYVVTFDNGINKSIYNINNKKVGLLDDNCINVERKLNTKLDNVSYVEYSDLNSLFEDFYDQQFRAIIVNENQYKYLENDISDSNKTVKILYEFEANGKKD